MGYLLEVLNLNKPPILEVLLFWDNRDMTTL